MSSFAGIIRRLPSEASIIAGPHGPECQGIMLGDRGQTRPLRAWLRLQPSIPAKVIKRMLYAGIYAGLHVTHRPVIFCGDTMYPAEAYEEVSQINLRQRHGRADEKGIALVYRDGNRFFGMLDGKRTIAVEGLGEDFVQPGAFYRAFIETRKHNGRELEFLVPLDFDEIQMTPEQALWPWHRKLPRAIRDQVQDRLVARLGTGISL